MRIKGFASLVALTLLYGSPPHALAADTITGEVVDMSCYMHDPATGKGKAHKKCAETCLKKGLPIGVLTDDGQVYLIVEDHDNPKPYAQLKEKATEKVTVEGEKKSHSGVQALVVQGVK